MFQSRDMDPPLLVLKRVLQFTKSLKHENIVFGLYIIMEDERNC